jgi:hypothetical protein
VSGTRTRCHIDVEGRTRAMYPGIMLMPCALGIWTLGARPSWPLPEQARRLRSQAKQARISDQVLTLPQSQTANVQQ